MKVVVINGVEYAPLIKEVNHSCNVERYQKLIIKSNIFKSRKP